ncbi:MAG: PAS domain-containing protein [Candidatus Zixiibacteriota bacterium]
MRTVIIGGGKGCRAIIELSLGGFLKELPLDMLYVVDLDHNAPGCVFAREHNLKTSNDMHGILSSTPNIELIIELTGNDEVLESIYKIMPPGARLIDHTFAHIFWDLVNAQEDQRKQLREITDLEQKIEKERYFLQSLFDTIPDPLVVLDRDKRTIKINKSLSEFSGLSPDIALGMTCDQLLSNTELAPHCRETAHLLDDVLETCKPHTLVWKTEQPEEAYWEVTRTPICDKDGTVDAILGVWHRITEKVKLRREIESAEHRFKSFIDSANDWISIKDIQGRYVIVNPAIADSFHLKVEDFIGKTPSEILPRGLARTIRMHDQEVLNERRHITYDEVINIDGHDRHYQTVRFPLTDYKGSIIGTCTIARDITSETELRDQLVQSTKLAAVGKLAAGVAHEINNPLTGILAYAEDMVDDFPGDDTHREDLLVIIRETMRCRDIVRNLLNFARQEAPRLEMLNLNQVVNQALSLVEKLPQFRNINIEKSLECVGLTIQGDQSQLQQVILNLMLNAAEAMKDKGTIKLITRYDQRQDKCIISVEDTGPGIPENLIDKLFEPFFSTKGTNGLGLAVSWGIIERHRGTIEIDTAEGGGAIFNIVLPAFVRNKKPKTDHDMSEEQ